MKKFTHETLVGLFVLTGLVCVAYLSFNLGNLRAFGVQEDYVLKARFTSVQGLSVGSKISLAGVKIGTVEKIELDNTRFVAIAHLRIAKSVILHDDSIASIRTNGLIGDRFILISPGASGIQLKPGELIVDTESALDLESLISKMAFGSVQK